MLCPGCFFLYSYPASVFVLLRLKISDFSINNILISNREDVKNPEFWARVCLHNIAKLAKEATTIRRVLECFFRYFDTGNLWSPKLGLGLSVLLDMQIIMENLGIIFLLSKIFQEVCGL